MSSNFTEPFHKTFFNKPHSFRYRDRLISLNKPLVMGILNITPDSFYDGGRYSTLPELMHQAEKMLSEGASILDLGAVSTRPGAAMVSPAEEKDRLIPVLAALRKQFPEALISVDTFRAEVAAAAVDAGAGIINDISAGNLDPGMFEMIARLKVPYIMMHMQGTPATMQENPHYEDTVKEIMLFFAGRLAVLRSMGVHDVVIDPGFGFGKTPQHNYEILDKLELFRFLEVPLLAGLSRKSMIYRLLDISPGEALNGTTSLNTIALLKGAAILRVHDVKEALEAVTLVQMLRSNAHN